MFFLNTRKTDRWSVRCFFLTLLMLPTIASAQQASLEERLRTELRNTTQQLRELQSRQARLEAARSNLEAALSNAEAQRDAAQAEVAHLKAKLKSAQGHLSSQRQNSQAQIAATQERAEQVRGAYDELLTLARGKEKARQQLQNALKKRTDVLNTCISRNEEMYKAGKEILSVYESLGAGSLFKIRQPLATSTRVKFENEAQAMGDRLYNAQVGVVEKQPEQNGDDTK